MSDKDSYAYPQATRLKTELWQIGGMTKREIFAMAAMQGFLSSLNHAVDIDAEGITNNAVILADYLLRRLEAE